ncbi:MAG: hypothetical protein ACOCT9_00685 [archaeon]
MNEYTTIKVSKRTLRRLHEIVGELTKQRGRRITIEDAIIQLLDNRNDYKLKNDDNNLKSSNDRREFIKMLEESFDGAGPKDFREYDYEDISRNG